MMGLHRRAAGGRARREGWKEACGKAGRSSSGEVARGSGPGRSSGARPTHPPTHPPTLPHPTPPRDALGACSWKDEDAREVWSVRVQDTPGYGDEMNIQVHIDMVCGPGRGRGLARGGFECGRGHAGAGQGTAALRQAPGTSPMRGQAGLGGTRCARRVEKGPPLRGGFQSMPR
jgi:hypothetical protein